MARFTFKCENEDNDTVNTIEFTAYSIHQVLAKVEQFIQGTSEFEIDGYLDIVQPQYEADDDEEEDEEEEEYKPSSSVIFKSMADDLIKNPPSMFDDTIQISLDDVRFDNMYNMTCAHQDDIIRFDDIKIEPFDFSLPGNTMIVGIDTLNNCPLCNLPKSVMETNKCWDEKCPFGTFEEIKISQR